MAKGHSTWASNLHFINSLKILENATNRDSTAWDFTVITMRQKSLQFIKKWQILTFKVNFLCQESSDFFSVQNDDLLLIFIIVFTKRNDVLWLLKPKNLFFRTRQQRSSITEKKEWAEAFDQNVHFCLPSSYLTGISETKTPRVLNFVALATVTVIANTYFGKLRYRGSPDSTLDLS
jgi:hypothetical protein